MDLSQIYTYNYTLSLLPAVEKIDTIPSFLVDTFFPNKRTTESEYVTVEYRRTAATIAPYLVNGTKGLNIARGESEVDEFKIPLVGARRVIGLEDLKMRQFGERPDIFNTVKPEERFGRMLAQDLVDLKRFIENRKAVMASDILQRGQIKLKQYADDGKVTIGKTIKIKGFNEIIPAIPWNDSAATIYDDLFTASEKIQEESGIVPTIAICGKNIERYLLANDEIKSWLMIPNRENLAMANFAPHFTSANARYIGRISALNLDLYSYADTYFDETGTKKYLVEPDNVIIGVPGKGYCNFSPVTFFQQGNWHTVNAPHVAKYSYDETAETTSLTLYSKFLLTPEIFNGWYCIKSC